MQKARLSLKTLWKLYQEGQDLLQARRFEDARQVFQRVDEARLRAGRAPDRAGTGDTPPSRQPNPLYIEASLRLSYCCVERGNTSEALRVLHDVLDVAPEHEIGRASCRERV